MLILKLLAKMIKVLRSEAAPEQVAGGFILGMIPGLTPLGSLHNVLVLLLIILLRVNVAAALFALALFSALAYLFDPLFHQIGYTLLVELPPLHGFWTALYNIPVLALGNLNNTVVLGSLISAIVFLWPVYVLSKKGVIVYREKVDQKIQRWKIVKVFRSSKIYTFYMRLKKLGG